MMRLGVVADTHSLQVPQQLKDDFAHVDLIIHAGDFAEMSVVNDFAAMGVDLKAVHGNRDEGDVFRKYPRKNIFKCEGVTIGLFHGEGPRNQVFARVQQEFAKDNVDLVIFGHTHQPLYEKVGDVIYFNPGSPNDEIFAPYCSYGIIVIDQDSIDPQLIKVTQSC